RRPGRTLRISVDEPRPRAADRPGRADMSGVPDDPNTTCDLPAGEPAESVRQRFEAAWQKALVGGDPPAVDAFVAAAGAAERPALREELTKLDAEYRRRLAQMRSLQGAAILAVSLDPAADRRRDVVGTETTLDVRAGPAAATGTVSSAET